MPSNTAGTSRGLVGTGFGLGLAILLLWVVALATISDLNGSDASGNGLAQFFGAAELISIWILLVVLLLVAGATGRIPTPAVFAALVPVPASGLPRSRRCSFSLRQMLRRSCGRSPCRRLFRRDGRQCD